MSIEQARQWLVNKPINPLTGRSIKEGSGLYRKLDNMANRLLSGGRCRTRWIKLTADEADLYQMSLYTRCKCGVRRTLHAVHTEYGDYECIRCNHSVDLRYFCRLCQNKTI